MFHFEHEEFRAVHPSAKDLITDLLKVDKAERLTCAQALQHEWFSQTLGRSDRSTATKQPLDMNALLALQNYKGNSQLKMEALNLLVKMVDETQISHL